MRLNSLRLTNFRQHADTHVSFDLGITGIIGPNGSGKSTLLEAIAWAIYGNPAARGTRDSIRWHGAPPRSHVRVELDFDLGGHRYRVERGLTSAELYLDGGPAPIASGINAVTDVLRKRLGMSREEFFNTYFTGQKELSVMAAMAPAERAHFLSRVLGYERLRTAQEILRKRRSVLSGELAGLKQGMPDPDQVARALEEARTRQATARDRARHAASRRREAERVLADATPRWERVQQDRERFHALLAELRVAESEEAALLRDRARVDRELTEIAAAREEFEKVERELIPLHELTTEYRRLEVLAREEGRRTALTDQCRALEAEVTKLRDRLARAAAAPTLEAELAATLDALRAQRAEADRALEARRSEWARDQQEAETKRDTLRKQYQELRAQYDQLTAAGASGVCPTCRQPLGDSYQSVMDFLAGQLETVRVEGKYYKDRLEQLRHAPEAVRQLEERRRRLDADVTAEERRLTRAQVARQETAVLATDIEEKSHQLTHLREGLAVIPTGYDPQRHDEVRHAVERLTALHQTATRLRLQAEREPPLVRDRAALADALAAGSARLEALRAQHAATPFSEQRFTHLHEAYTRALEALRDAELAAVAAEGDASAARDALAGAEAAARDLAERQRLLQELGARRRLHDELDRAYTDLRGELNADLRPELSEVASRFLAELTDGRYSELQVDEHYDIIVHEGDLPKPVISGGEEDLANLVLRLAISQMIAERAGQPLSLLILDEIFGSLDDTRRASVLDLLRRLQDRFEQVIVITHIESVREGLDRVITVRYNDATGASAVESAGGDAVAAARVVPSYEEAGAAD